MPYVEMHSVTLRNTLYSMSACAPERVWMACAKMSL